MTEAHDDVAQRLWREIDKIKIGMLGLSGDPPRHMQPMTAFCEEDGGSIWFYTRNDTDLARDTGAGHTAMFCLMSKDQEFIACIAGRLALDHDRERIDMTDRLQWWHEQTTALAEEADSPEAAPGLAYAFMNNDYAGHAPATANRLRAIAGLPAAVLPPQAARPQQSLF